MIKFPPHATPEFQQLCATLALWPEVMAPDVKNVIMSQLALESGWGNSELAREHLNFSGMKWRSMMIAHAEPTLYQAWDGKALYCKFATIADFINGYFFRLDKHPSYAQWRRHAAVSGEAFIRYVGPIWLGMDAASNAQYVANVLRIARGERER